MGVAAVPFDPTGGAGMNAAGFARENAMIRAAMQGQPGFNMQFGQSSDESMKMLQMMLPLILAQSQQEESSRQFDEMMGLRRDEAKQTRKGNRLDKRLAQNQMDLAERQQDMAESLQAFQLDTAKENRTIGERTAALGALPLFFQGEQGRFDENLARAEQKVRDDAARTANEYQTGFTEAVRSTDRLAGITDKLDSDDYDRNEVQRILQAATNNLGETLGQFTSSGMSQAQAEGFAAGIWQRKQALKGALGGVTDEADKSRFRDSIDSLFESGPLRTFTQENYHVGFLPGVENASREKISQLYSAASEERNMGRQTQARILESLLTAKDPSQIGEALGQARGFDLKDDVLTGLPFGPQPNASLSGNVSRETVSALVKGLQERPTVVPEMSGGPWYGGPASSGVGVVVSGISRGISGAANALEAERNRMDVDFPGVRNFWDALRGSPFWPPHPFDRQQQAAPAMMPGSPEEDYLRRMSNTGLGQPLR